MKVLNLYCGLGGNRKLWENVDVTAIEMDFEIAELYQELYPDDKVIIGDACQYLENNFQKFDFIWSSPPCSSHGQLRHNLGVLAKGFKPILPDMTLYSQIIFLQAYCKNAWIIENTRPYYKPIIEPTFKLQRHYFWSNYIVLPKKFLSDQLRKKTKLIHFDNYEIVAQSNIKNKRQVLRNCVDSNVGKYIFESILNDNREE